MFIFSIDWEDAPQLKAKIITGNFSKPSFKIEAQTNHILDLCDNYNIKATFFCLGILAETHGYLIREIYSRGHEIALHSNKHQNLFDLSYEEIREDIRVGKDIITNIIGDNIYGYRAPNLSLTQNRLGVLEILAELEFVYDSSIFPTPFAKNNISNFPSDFQVYLLKNGKTIVELPLTTFPIFGRRFPIAGGSYFRLLPFWSLKCILNKINLLGLDMITYLHPYEFYDLSYNYAENVNNLTSLSKIKFGLVNCFYNYNRKSVEDKTRFMFENFLFQTCFEKAKFLCGSQQPLILKY